MTTMMRAFVVCVSLMSAEALASPDLESPCEISLGLDLGPHAGPLALADDGLEQLAALALLGPDADLLALSSYHSLSTRVGFDGLRLQIVVTGSCADAIALQRRRLAHLLRPSVRPHALPHAEALMDLRAILPAARAAHLASHARAPLALTDVVALVTTVLQTAPLSLEALPRSHSPLLRARLLDGFSHPRLRAVPSPPAPPARRPLPIALPPSSDGLGRLWLVFRVPTDVGPVLSALLSHPGLALTHHLREQHGLVESLEASWFPAIETLVLAVTIANEDIRTARDQLFAELSTVELDPDALSGALALSATAPPPALVERALRETLVPSNASAVYALPREDDTYPIIDADLIAQWVSAQVDMRCPPPGETRPASEVLRDEHDLDPDRFLLLTRILGRDRDRMSDLDRELEDRCQELAKLRRLMPPKRLFALHRAIACAPPPRTEDEERQRRESLCRKAGIDVSAYPPLVAMARREPALRHEIARIDNTCGVSR